jgi:hypothetical protein
VCTCTERTVFIPLTNDDRQNTVFEET